MKRFSNKMLKFDTELAFDSWCNIHRATHNVRPIRLIDDPIRTINVNSTLNDLSANKCIITYATDVHYSCISYAWANVDGWSIGERPWPSQSEDWIVTSMSKSALIIILNTCIKMKIDYIWIDAFCIDQKSRIEKQQEIPKMAKIYQNADKILVLWRNECETKMLEFLSPKWMTRVWTFQEIVMAGWKRVGDKPIYYIIKVNNEELCKFITSFYHAIFVSFDDTEACNELMNEKMEEMYMDDEDKAILYKTFFIDTNTHKSLIKKIGCPCTIRDRLMHSTIEDFRLWFETNKERHIVTEGHIMSKIIPLCNIRDHEVADCPCISHTNISVVHAHWKNMTTPSTHPDCVDKHKTMTQLHNSQLLSIPDILRIISIRDSTYEEDRVYGIIGLLGIETIKIEYGIGIRTAIGKLAAAMSVDQRILLSIVDTTTGVWPDGYCMVPKMIDSKPAWHFNITKTLSQAEFMGHSGMHVTGLTCFIGRIQTNKKTGVVVGSDDCEIIVSRDKNLANKSNDVIGYGFAEDVSTDVHAILAGVCDKKEICSIVGGTDCKIKPNVIVVLCTDQGATLHKIGLAAVDATQYAWSIKRCLVV